MNTDGLTPFQRKLVAKMDVRIDAGVRWLNQQTSAFWNAFENWCLERDLPLEKDILDCNWLEGIDLEILDLADEFACVLGQVSSARYERFKEFANLSSITASELGFFLHSGEYGMRLLFSTEHYSLLTERWIAKIRGLRQEAGYKEPQTV